MDVSERKLNAALWAAAILAGALQAWAERFSIEPDGVNYLDISYAYLHHDWHDAVNAYWSPLYSWLLALVLGLTHTSLCWESTVLHALNFAIYILALVCFAFFFRELTALCGERASATNEHSPRGWAWSILGYSLFTYVSLDLIGVGLDKPDMIVTATFYLATAIVIRIQRGYADWLGYAALGAILAIGYFAKTAMFPLAFVFLFCSIFAAQNWKRAAPRATLALVVFMAIASPWVAALSHSKGRVTFGDSGRQNYAAYVNGLTASLHWHGEIPGAGTPTHGTRLINEVPPVDEFATPIAGTYPPWYDSTYWNDGVRPHFVLGGQLHELAISIGDYYRLVSEEKGLAVGLLALALFAGSAQAFGRGFVAIWPVWLPAVATLGLYALVLVEKRYVAAPILILWCCLFVAVPLQNSEAASRVWNCVALAAALTVCTTIAREAGSNVVAILKGPENTELEVSQDVAQLGLRPGDKVAILGHQALGDYWAHLAQVRIVADVPAENVPAYWDSSAETKSRILNAISHVGAKLLITRFPPPASQSQGWRHLGNTDYYALPLSTDHQTDELK